MISRCLISKSLELHQGRSLDDSLHAQAFHGLPVPTPAASTPGTEEGDGQQAARALNIRKWSEVFLAWIWEIYGENFREECGNNTGWWFQTMDFYVPFHTWDVILPIDELTPSFFKKNRPSHFGWNSPKGQDMWCVRSEMERLNPSRNRWQSTGTRAPTEDCSPNM